MKTACAPLYQALETQSDPTPVKTTCMFLPPVPPELLRVPLIAMLSGKPLRIPLYAYDGTLIKGNTIDVEAQMPMKEITVGDDVTLCAHNGTPIKCHIIDDGSCVHKKGRTDGDDLPVDIYVRLVTSFEGSEFRQHVAEDVVSPTLVDILFGILVMAAHTKVLVRFDDLPICNELTQTDLDMLCTLISDRNKLILGDKRTKEIDAIATAEKELATARANLAVIEAQGDGVVEAVCLDKGKVPALNALCRAVKE